MKFVKLCPFGQVVLCFALLWQDWRRLSDDDGVSICAKDSVTVTEHLE